MIIWGLRSRGKALGQFPISCPNCHREAMTTISQSRRWFSLFFIPIFPISAKKSIARCNLCGFQYQFDNVHADQLAAAAQPRQA